ncbi:MAG: hypothetical protein ABJC39_05640 [Chloroflexota bacterium]
MTCQNFRRSVAGQLGYCGLDRQRRPLQGDEIRGCWEPAVALAGALSTGVVTLASPPPDPADERTPVRKLEFVEVRTLTSRARGRSAAGAGVTKSAGEPGHASAGSELGDAEPPASVLAPAEPGWSLWGDAEI